MKVKFTTTHLKPILISLVAILASFFFFTPEAFATTLTWTGNNATKSISLADNWSPAQAPTANDDLVINTTADAISWDASAPDTINSLTLGAGYTGTLSMTKALTVTDDMTVAAGTFQTADCETPTDVCSSTGRDGSVIVTGTLLIDTDGTFVVRRRDLTTATTNSVGATVAGGYGQLITVGNLTVNGNMNANGQGFKAGVGPGIGGFGVYGDGSGYGGVGGKSVGGVAGGQTYGAFSNPVSLGSGGQKSNTAGPGGGAIILLVNDTLTVHGVLSANGGPNVNVAGGGSSGGTINITANTLTGSGSIQALGGIAPGRVQNGGGGGGRIDLSNVTNWSFGGSDSLSSISVAHGGLTSTYDPGQAGTINWPSNFSLTMGTGGGGNYVTSVTMGYDGSNNYDFGSGSLTINDGATLTIGGHPSLHQGMATAGGGGPIISAVNIIINEGGNLNANDQGFARGAGPGAGVGGGTYGDGAGYGGVGGKALGGVAGGGTYGSFSNPVSLGSGGQSNLYGGLGGGALIFSISDTFMVNGTLSANGGNSIAITGGGGSGGTINITTNTLTGSGSVQAIGGRSTTRNQPGGGGGGRIDLSNVTNWSFGGSDSLSSISVAHGGLTSTYDPGQAGTINWPSNFSLTMGTGGGGNYVTSVTMGYDGSNNYDFGSGSLTINDGATLTIGGHPSLHQGMATAGGGGPIISAVNIIINEGGNLNANDQGFARGAGPGAGVGGGTYGDGAGYGGVGGKALGGVAGGGTYGSFSNPVSLGSGGQSNLYGGLGGGALIFSISDTFMVNGTLSANGGNSIAITGGGGSGGTINITTNTLTGSGSVQAIGGRSTTRSQPGTGSGGRIAIIYTNAEGFAGLFQAYAGSSTNNGAAGTIYTNGVLTVDNNGITTASGVDTLISDLVTDTSVDSIVLANAGNLAIDSGKILTTTGTGTTLSIASGTTLTNNGTLVLAGTAFTNSGTWTNAADSLVKFTGQENDAAVTIPAGTYDGIEFDNAGTTFGIAGNLTVNGNWTNTAGTVLASSGTVTFSGSSNTIFGDNTFYNLSKIVEAASSLIFESGKTVTIENSLVLQGGDTQLLEISATNFGAEAFIDIPANHTLEFIEVSDSHNTNEATIPVSCPSATCNEGSNTNWFTPLGPALSLSGYRWFENLEINQDEREDFLGASLTDEQDTSTPAPAKGLPFRLRLLIHAASTQEVGTEFHLQLAELGDGLSCSEVSEDDWGDVDLEDSAIVYYNNPGDGMTDGADISSHDDDPTHEGHQVVPQAYEESNPFAVTDQIDSGEDGLWDFALVNNSSTGGSYCFRVVTDVGGVPIDHIVYPTLSVIPAYGILTSTIFDTGVEKPSYNSIYWNGTLPIGTAVRFQFATAEEPEDFDGTWYGLGDGSGICNSDPDTFLSYYYQPSEPTIPASFRCSPTFDGKQYFRYRLILCSDTSCQTSGGDTPSVEKVFVNWSP